MQPQAKDDRAPLEAPQRKMHAPALSGAARVRWSLWLMVLGAVLIAAGLYLRSRAQAQARAKPEAVVRTVSVGGGTVERVLRLTGVTSAENFVTLIAPQMRGSRSGRGRERSSGGSSSGGSSSSSSSSSSGSSQITSNANRSSGGSDTSSASAGSSGDDSSVASTGGSSLGGSRSTSSALKAATSRVSSGGKTSSAASSRAAASAASASMGAEGLGTTGGSLGQGLGGSSGGHGDYALILQDLVKPGSYVKKGAKVAEFDRQYMLQRLDDYRASVAQAEASFKRQRAELDITRKAHRQQIDSAKGSVDKAGLDLKTTPVRSAIESERFNLSLEEAQAQHKQLLGEVKYVDIREQAQIRDSEIDLEQTKIELKRAEANADRMVARAPIDGLTVMQTTFRGTEFSQIQQGDQLFPGQPYMQIVDLRSMVVNATVNQADVEVMRVGARARVRFDAYPDLELPARVYSVGAMTRPGGFRASYLKEIPVRLRLERADPRAIPDLSVSVDVILETEAKATVAPLESIFRDSGEAKPHVYLRSSTGWEKREVELGLVSNVAAAVRSGLRPGEVIARERPPTGTIISTGARKE